MIGIVYKSMRLILICFLTSVPMDRDINRMPHASPGVKNGNMFDIS